MTQSQDPLAHLGPLIRILGALIDAMIADDFQEWRVLGAVKTAMNRETPERHGINKGRNERALRDWGAMHPDPEKRLEQIFNAAGLSDRLQKVAFLYYDRGFRPFEIAEFLNLDPDTARQQVHRVEEKLRGLGARTRLD